MSAPSRSHLIEKTYKAIKKQYKPVTPPERTLLEHVLFASLLENSSFEAAEKALETLHKSFYDLNEVRVTSLAELAEMLAGLHDPRAGAFHLRKVLHAVFESTYSFDLEALKKKTIGQAIKDLEKCGGTPFAVAYATQVALGGHAIPLDQGALDALTVLGVVTDKERESGGVPGLERAIPKNKGVEFFSLLHQLGVDLLARPFAPELRDFLMSINPECRERLPKRGVKREDGPAAKPSTPEKPQPAPMASGKTPPKPATGKPPAGKTPPAKTDDAAKKPEPAKKPEAKKPAPAGEKTADKPAEGGKSPAPAKPAAEKSGAEKSPAKATAKPSGDKSASDKSASDKSASDKPASDKPAGDKTAAKPSAKPAEGKGAESKAGDVKSPPTKATKPADAKSAEAKSAETKSPETKSPETKPAAAKPAAKPAEKSTEKSIDKSTDPKPAAKPSSDKPASEKSGADKLAGDKLSGDKRDAGKGLSKTKPR